MSVPETVDFDKNGKTIRFSPIRQLFLALVIILVAVLAFGIGRLSGEGNSEPVKIEYNSQLPISNFQSMNNENSMKTENSQIENLSAVYASSKGKRYYYPWCKSTVSEANKVTFADPKMAESAGYTLAVNCKPK